MTKFVVKKNRQLLYPDGSVRGRRGCVIDGTQPGEGEVVAAQAAALERTGRQTPVSPCDPARMIVVTEKQPVAKKVAKKKATKKKPSGGWSTS